VAIATSDRGLDQQLVQINVVLVAQGVRDPADLDGAFSSPQASEWTTREHPSWGPVMGAMADEQVGDRQQPHSAHQEQAAVQRGQPEPHAARGHTAPKLVNEPGSELHLRREDARQRLTTV
jgi:hypothetical protein